MKTKHISLSYLQPGDSRKPRQVRLMVQDEEWKIETLADLSEHEFTLLMAGHTIKVEAEI